MARESPRCPRKQLVLWLARLEFDHGILEVSNLSKQRCRARATTTMAAVVMVEVTATTIAAIAMVVPTVAVEAGVRPAAITVFESLVYAGRTL